MSSIRIDSGFTREQLCAVFDAKVTPFSNMVFFNNPHLWSQTFFYGRRRQYNIFLARHTANTRNAMATVFRGKIIETSSGSAIVGRFSKFYGTVVFMSLWLVVWVAASLALLFSHMIWYGLLSFAIGALAALLVFGHRGKTKQKFIEYLGSLV